LLLSGEVRLGDPSVERRCSDVLHNQIRAAGPITEDIVHFGHVEVYIERERRRRRNALSSSDGEDMDMESDDEEG
jgi:hypothetical protein